MNTAFGPEMMAATRADKAGSPFGDRRSAESRNPAGLHAGRPFGNERFVKEMGDRFGRQWAGGRPGRAPATDGYERADHSTDNAKLRFTLFFESFPPDGDTSHSSQSRGGRKYSTSPIVIRCAISLGPKSMASFLSNVRHIPICLRLVPAGKSKCVIEPRNVQTSPDGTRCITPVQPNKSRAAFIVVLPSTNSNKTLSSKT